MALTFTNTTITSGYKPSQINTNFTDLVTLLAKGLNREGGASNAMAANLDLGSNDIINVGDILATNITIGGTSLATQVAAAAASASAASASAASASSSASAASSSASAASSSASSSSTSATLASQWATQLTTLVASTDYSSKEYAIGSVALSAKRYATSVGAYITGTDYSAKEWAVGTAGRGNANEGSSKDWATYITGTVDDTEYSAKYYAQAAASIVGGDRLTIGTGGTPPTVSKLELYDNSSNGVYTHYTNVTTGTTGTDGFKVGIGTDEVANLWNYENTDLVLATNNSPKVYVKASGNISIGGDYNIDNLAIYGSSSSFAHFITSTTGVTASDGFRVGVNSTTNDAVIWNYENTDLYLGTNDTSRLIIDNAGGIYTANATGGATAVGTINTKGYYLDGVLISGDDTGSTYFDRAGLPVCNNTLNTATANFDIAANIGTSFESVGPTGAGGTNEWSGMNGIPTTAKFVILKIYNRIIGSTNTEQYLQAIYVRKTGSTATSGLLSTYASLVSFYNRSGLQEDAQDVATAIVAIDSNRRFDIARSAVGTGITTNATMSLVGWL